ncbi:caspase domain-containing protein [Gautieria morchelliformis]|nr:caspase domain-containing protein [Gautieria morchelliformis]
MQSRGTVSRKALCIGIRYSTHKHNGEVPGAHNDATHLASFLRKEGYEVDVMLDDGNGPNQPTKKNVSEAVKRLVAGAQAQDRLFFHFSGHGAQMINMDGTERDGLDELLLPVDYRINQDYPGEHDRNHWFEDSRILDDELNSWFIESLPMGCRLTVVIDTCHSGTAFDLKYNYNYSCDIGRLGPPDGWTVCESPTKKSLDGNQSIPKKSAYESTDYFAHRQLSNLSISLKRVTNKVLPLYFLELVLMPRSLTGTRRAA